MNLIHYELVPLFTFLITLISQVVALDVDLPVKQAFHILHEQVYTRENTFSFFIDPCSVFFIFRRGN